MKNTFNLILLIYFISNCNPALLSQEDNLWYIKNGQMINNGTYQSRATSDFLITKIGLPNISCNTLARDHFFAIFENGLYYNSRNDESRQSQSNEPGNLQIGGYRYFENGNNHDLRLQSGNSKITFLYASNIYDEDPPEGVALVGSTTDEPINVLSPFIADKIVTANHDVRPDHDITLILNMTGQASGEYTLTLNSVKRSQTYMATYSINPENRVFNPGQIFEASNVFGTQQYWHSNKPENFNITSFNNQELIFEYNGDITDTSLLYINLAPTSLMHQFIVENEPPYLDEDGEVINKAGFFLKDDKNDLIDLLEEEIRTSHDPNYLYATSICESKNTDFIIPISSHHIKFECQFQNIRPTPASNLFVEMRLPPYVMPNSIKMLACTIEGEPVTNFSQEIEIKSSDGITSFYFKKATIGFCTTGKPDAGIVNFSFCAKINYEQFDISEPVNVVETSTIFDYQTEMARRYILEYDDMICEKNEKDKDSLECIKTIDRCDECNKSFWTSRTILAAAAGAGVLGYAVRRRIKVKEEKIESEKFVRD